MGQLKDSFTKEITCPYCAKQVSVVVDQEVNCSTLLSPKEFVQELRAKRAIAEGRSSSEAAGITFVGQLDPAQRQMLAVAESAGLLEPFAAAFEAAHGVKPKNLQKAILGWLRSARPKLISQGVMDAFRAEFPGSINFVASQSVGGVTCNGELVQFLPCIIAGDAPVGAVTLRTPPAKVVEQVGNWIRTKYGYVAGRGAMLNDLRNKSYGDFCKPIQ